MTKLSAFEKITKEYKEEERRCKENGEFFDSRLYSFKRMIKKTEERNKIKEMNNGIKLTQKQIEGRRRERINQRRENKMKVKFPILHITFIDALPILLACILAIIVGILIP